MSLSNVVYILVELVRTSCVTEVWSLMRFRIISDYVSDVLSIESSSVKSYTKNKILCHSNEAKFQFVLHQHCCRSICCTANMWAMFKMRYMHDRTTCWSVTIFCSSSKIGQLMCMNLITGLSVPRHLNSFPVEKWNRSKKCHIAAEGMRLKNV